MAKRKQEKVKVFALGGVGELGKNMYVIEVNGDIFVIDAGAMFPEGHMYGIDVVIPDITYLKENHERVQGIFLTHAHEDHIGGLPYVLKQLNVPVYGTEFTLAIVKSQLKDAGFSKNVKLNLIDPDEEIDVGKVKISFFRTNHNVPDSIGVCIHSRYGEIVHTGDFTFDSAYKNHKAADLREIAAIGNKGVLCLLSDSTNAQFPGVADSEKKVEEQIKDVFQVAKGRIVVTCMASNIHRLQQVFDAAASNNRKVVAVGQHMKQMVRIAKDLNDLDIHDQVLVKSVRNLSDRQVVTLTSGAKGEMVSALVEMINNKDQQLKIRPEDTVMIADTPPLKNEKRVAQTIDELVRIGANVIYDRSLAQDGGHGFAEELKLMLRLMMPRYFIPVHGEYRMLKVHSNLAEAVGVPGSRIFIAEKGEVVEFTDGMASWSGKIPSGNVLVDGSGIGDVGNIVLRDRKLLSEDGILLVVVTLGKKTKEILAGPEIISRGFVYVRESEHLLGEASRIVSDVLEGSIGKNISEWSSLKTGVRDSLSRFLFDQTKRKPIILPIIMEV